MKNLISNIDDLDALEYHYNYFDRALKTRLANCKDERIINYAKSMKHKITLRMLEWREGYTFFDMPVDVVVDNLHKIHESNEPYVKFWFHRYEQSMMWEVSKQGGII